MGFYLSEAQNSRGLLDYLAAAIHEHQYTAIAVSVIWVAVFYLRLRRRSQGSTTSTSSWTDDEKAFSDSLPSLPDLVSEYAHPLAQALFQEAGIPTSGDMARRELLDSSSLAHTQFPVSLPTSGDLAAMSAPSTAEEQRHPWRRHSYPERQSGANLSQHQREAIIKEDAVEFFRDDNAGKIWRRRTIEFGSLSK